MKKIRPILFAILFVFGWILSANALQIQTSAIGSGDGTFDDNYSYLFTIDDGNSNDGTFTATLKNTSYSSSSNALIDLLAFNIDAILGTDFNITNVVPNWTFSDPSGNGIQFDYVGGRDDPEDRLSPGDILSFDFVFGPSFTFPSDPFTLWTATNSSAGSGIGGGNDVGQVAVSFQQLGSIGNDSDLLASNWTPVPEPSTVLLVGTGLLGIIGFGRKRLNKKA
jgi:hypothetical protein